MTIERKKEIFEWIIKNHSNSAFAQSYEGVKVDFADESDYAFAVDSTDFVYHFYCADLGLRGCGNILIEAKYLANILRSLPDAEHSMEYYQDKDTEPNDPEEVVAPRNVALLLLDSHGFTNHCNSIYRSEITDKGKMFLDALEDMLSRPDSDSSHLKCR